LLILPFQPAAAQRLHEIRLEGDPLTGVFRFVPAKVRARAGDVLRFVVQSGGPHAIGFRPAGLGRASREALNGAMPDRLGDLRGPLLISPGTEYRITVPALPAGTYEFFCLTHLAYGMTGALIVGAPPPR
jgi:plastocyanin